MTVYNSKSLIILLNRICQEYNFQLTSSIHPPMTSYLWNTQRVKIPSKDSITMPKYAMDRKTSSTRRLCINKACVMMQMSSLGDSHVGLPNSEVEVSKKYRDNKD